MPSRIRRIVFVLATCAAFTLLAITRSTGQTSSAPERLTAFAVNMSDVGPTQSGTVEMVVTRWSTENERKTLTAALLDQRARHASGQTARVARSRVYPDAEQHRV